MFSHKHFNSSDSVNTWRNVSLKIALIAFRCIQKDPKISFKCFLFASKSPVISLQLWQLWRNTLRYTNANNVTM